MGISQTIYSWSFLCGNFNKVCGTVCGRQKKATCKWITMVVHSSGLKSLMFRTSPTFLKRVILLKENLWPLRVTTIFLWVCMAENLNCLKGFDEYPMLNFKQLFRRLAAWKGYLGLRERTRQEVEKIFHSEHLPNFVLKYPAALVDYLIHNTDLNAASQVNHWIALSYKFSNIFCDT
jgi:hypothetical protein